MRQLYYPTVLIENMFSRVLTVFAFALAVAATSCPNCPATDLLGNALVAKSGGTLGTPRFCGCVHIAIESFFDFWLFNLTSAGIPPTRPAPRALRSFASTMCVDSQFTIFSRLN
jgi:hypothetical protein